MKRFTWFFGAILVVAIFGCGNKNNQEEKIEITGKVAQVASYNPVRGDMDYDFCIWLTITNNSDQELLFDQLECAWLYTDAFVLVTGSLDKGDVCKILPGQNYKFHFTTGGQGQEYNDSLMNFEVILTYTENREEIMALARAQKEKIINATTREREIIIADLKKKMRIRTFGSYLSQRFPCLYELPSASNQISEPEEEGEYYPVTFSFMEENLDLENLEKIRSRIKQN